jgi:hypothetical protein
MLSRSATREVLNEVSLRVTAPANGQTKGIRWAADHELPT